MVGVPASAEGLDEFYGAGHFADAEGHLCLLVGEQSGLGGDDVEVRVEAGLVAVLGDGEIALGGVDGEVFAGDLVGGDADRGDVVLNLLEGGENGLAIGGDIGVVLGGVLGDGGFAETAVEDGLRSGAAGGPEQGWEGEEAGDVRAFEAAGAGKGHVGVVGGLLDADEGVRFGEGAFAGGDVGASLQELGREANRDGGDGGGEVADGEGEAGGGLADKGGNGVLVDSTILGDAGSAFFCVAEGDLGFGGSFRAVDTGFYEGAGEFERLAVGRDGFVVEVLEGILATELEVVFGEKSLLGEAFVFKVGGGDLGGVLILADGVADASPEVGLPGDVEGEAEVGEGATAGGGGGA